jgi:hypothetical protein
MRASGHDSQKESDNRGGSMATEDAKQKFLTAIEDAGQELLRFAVRFAETDLETLRPGDWMNLRDELKAVVAPAIPMPGVLVSPIEIQELTDDFVKALREDFRRLLAPVADGQLQPASGTARRAREETVRIGEMGIGVRPDGAIYMSGAPRDVALMKLVYRVALNTEAVRRCPECGRLFYRVRRQLYCSRVCVSRVNKRDERKAKPPKKAKKAKKGNR